MVVHDPTAFRAKLEALTSHDRADTKEFQRLIRAVDRLQLTKEYVRIDVNGIHYNNALTLQDIYRT